MQYLDLHCDTLRRMQENAKNGTPMDIWENDGHICLRDMTEAGYLAQFFACFPDFGKPSFGASHFDDVLEMIQIMKDSIEKYPQFALATDFTSYLKNKADGKISAFLAVEEGGAADTLENLQTLFDAGVRLITITWNYENAMGFPNFEYIHQHAGLKPYGIEAVTRMNELGIIADASHLSDGGFWDLVKYSKRPFLASHSNARTVREHTRNLTDDMLKALADKGGITGINFAGYFLTDDGASTVESMVRHIRHIINVAGREVPALGTDFDGIGGELEIAHPTEMHKLPEAMEKAGFTTGEIEAFCYQNTENFLRRFWA